MIAASGGAKPKTSTNSLQCDFSFEAVHHDNSGGGGGGAMKIGADRGAFDLRTGTFQRGPDIGAMADNVRTMRSISPDAGHHAQQEWERSLSPVDAGLLRRDLGAPTQKSADCAPTFSATGLAHSPAVGGSTVLRANPQLEIRWETTKSPVTNKSGFTAPLQKSLDAAKIRTDIDVNPVPANAINNNSKRAANINGAAARDAIAVREAGDGHRVSTEQVRKTSLGNRHVDVVVDIRAKNPENNRRIEIESKLGRASNSKFVRTQVAKDAERLASNVSARNLGYAAKGIGRVVRPIGVVVDAVQLGRAFRADGNRIGSNTVRAGANLAGGAAGALGGAKLGAVIGTAVGGPVGTVVGGVIGGVAGGVIGSGAANKAVDFVKGLF